MNSILKNKKAEAFMVDVWAIIVFIVIILVFLILFTSTKKDLTTQINESFAGTETSNVLINLIRTPVTVQGKDMTFGDLVILYQSTDDDKYKSEIQTDYDEIMAKLDTSKCYHFTVSDTKLFRYSKDCQCVQFTDPVDVSLLDLEGKPFDVHFMVCEKQIKP